MSEIAETIYGPELEGGLWIGGPAVSLKAARGRQVMLIDFWDYTCVNCVRTLPYVTQWHHRYAQSGLVVVGVHAPEFSFARDRVLVSKAVEAFKLPYPIVMDNDYAIWRAYSNRYWPAKYLIDTQGRIRYYHFGEGGYGETERMIQHLLHELNPAAQFPPLMEPVRDTDVPGAVCYRVTPELYLGYSRGQFGNPQGIVKDRAHEYRDVGRYAEALVYLSGAWKVGAEAASAAASQASLTLR